MLNSLLARGGLAPASNAELRQNLFSGLTVALAMVPEAIAFAFVAQVHPLTGLYAAFLMCLITAVFGGRPGMISGATGALAVVMVSLVVTHGVEYLFATVVVMGLIQLVAGALRLGKFIRMVPHPVMLGFVNGLALVIFMAQLGHFQDDSGTWLSGVPLYTMAGLTALTMALIYLLPRLSKALPASLIAILSVAALVHFFGLETRTVGDMADIAGGLPQFHVPQVPWNLETLWIVLPYSMILAAIGLIESLLTLNLIDDITDTRGQPNRECLAQGAGNVITGFFGGMGGCAMIGQSMINVNSGGTRRMAGIVAALALIAFIVFLSEWISLIPLAALVGLMFVVAEKTFEWGSVRILGRVPKHDALVIVAVTVVTVLTDLAIAVGVGVVISALVFAWQHAKDIVVKTRLSGEGNETVKTYEVRGTLFFASTANFLSQFAPKDDPLEVVVEFRDAKVMDHSAIEAIEALAERYSVQGKRIHLRHLSPDCRELLTKARSAMEMDAVHDPHYHLADDRLG